MIRMFSQIVGKCLPAALCILFLTGGTSYAGWHELTQAQRNNQIVNQAWMVWLKNPPVWGGVCKDWVRTVVQQVSTAAGGPQVTIPATSPNADGYDWAIDNTNVLRYGTLPPSALEPGMIVQMRTRMSGGGYSPHTFIVISNWPSLQQFSVIESNYSVSMKVTSRTINYSAFPGTGATPMIEPYSHYNVFAIK